MLAAYYQKGEIEAGCDEAGRGCLAGPVFAAAVILPKGFRHELLDDSKKMTEASRNILRPIIEKEALAWGVGSLSPKQIDKYNILWSSFRAMHKAIDKLKIKPTSLLIDGNRFLPYKKIPHHCLVKGDARFLSIAAASVLAKTYRDAYMLRKAKAFPAYHWETNKGYPTQAHRNAIMIHGPCKLHRESFRLLPEGKIQGDLFLNGKI